MKIIDISTPPCPVTVSAEPTTRALPVGRGDPFDVVRLTFENIAGDINHIDLSPLMAVTLASELCQALDEMYRNGRL